MATLNKVILIGRLGNNPERKKFGDNIVTKFNLATSESFKNKTGEWQEVTEWHTIETWQDNKIIQNLTKGQQVFIEGSIKTDTYEKNGEKRYMTKIKANKIGLLERFVEAPQHTEAPPHSEADEPFQEPSIDNLGEDGLPF